jgi:hypothetical protein
VDGDDGNNQSEDSATSNAEDEQILSSEPAFGNTAPWLAEMEFNRYRSEQARSYYLERRTEILWATLILTVSFLLASAGTTIGIFLLVSLKYHHPFEGSIVIGASWFLAILVVITGILFRATRRANKEPHSTPSRAKSRFDDSTTDERLSVLRALSTYQELSQRQANSSYRIAQMAIFGGFVLLLVGGAVAVKTSAATVQLVVGGLAAVGTAISGYIGATAIRMYNRAQAQMNFYYAQPMVQYYLLQAERMTKNLKTTTRADKSMENVIAQTLNIASVAAALITRSGDTPTVGRGRSDGRIGMETPDVAGQPKTANDDKV